MPLPPKMTYLDGATGPTLVTEFVCADCRRPATQVMYARTWDGQRTNPNKTVFSEPIRVEREHVEAVYTCDDHYNTVVGELVERHGSASGFTPWADEAWRQGDKT